MLRGMELGAFSLSLTVKDLAVSMAFYAKLGFEKTGGDGVHYAIFTNPGGGTVIGLYQGMFDKNMLTFNPGWDGPHRESAEFTDVRELEATLRAAGVEITSSNTAESESGPAHFTTVDPDGNPILVDQHR